MLRWVARCAALVVLVVCGGVLASMTLSPLGGSALTDHKIDQGWSDTAASTLLMGVRINPVSLQDFKRHLRTAKNPYDVFRIFFNKMDLSDTMIGELLAARSIESFLDSIQKKSLDEEDYSELAYSDHTDYNEELEMAYGHMLEMEDSPLAECKDPRPEILHVEDPLHPHRRLFPECTVVHRCRKVSGCCGSPDYECGPKKIRIDQKAFFVLDTVGGDQVQPSDEVVTIMPIVEHVECECRQIKRLPECNQGCPFPFTKMRPHVRCTCDCPDRPHEQPNRCHHVKEGRVPLDPDDLARIKSGEYLRPECRIGMFDVKTGYCPPVPHDYDFIEKSRSRMQTDEHNMKRRKSRRH